MRQEKVDAWRRLIIAALFGAVLGYTVIRFADTGIWRYAIVALIWLALWAIIWLFEE